MQNAFVLSTTTVQFSANPKTGYGTGRERRQPRDYSLGGTLYLYDRGTRTIQHRLQFDKQSAAVLDALESFHDTVTRGATKTFTWYDQAAAAHTVRLSGDITVTEPYPGRFSISLVLEENT